MSFLSSNIGSLASSSGGDHTNEAAGQVTDYSGQGGVAYSQQPIQTMSRTQAPQRRQDMSMYQQPQGGPGAVQQQYNPALQAILQSLNTNRNW